MCKQNPADSVNDELSGISVFILYFGMADHYISSERMPSTM